MKTAFLAIVGMVLVFSSVEIASAQFYIGPNVGFRAYSLKGTYKRTTQQGTQTGNVVDAGKTAFNFGLSTGYEVSISGWYKLDVGLDATFSSVPFFEAAWNSQFGAGNFAAIGLSSGSTRIISIDIMPIHRLTLPKFKTLSPYAGLGLGLNITSTSDITIGPPTGNGTFTGNSEFKIGLLVYYGTIIRATDAIQPFVQFKHLIPFGSETPFTQSFQFTGGQGGGSGTQIEAVQDVPGYFNLSAGVRFALN